MRKLRPVPARPQAGERLVGVRITPGEKPKKAKGACIRRLPSFTGDAVQAAQCRPALPT